ncbi:MAG TPA: sigma-54-dependent Fis family transcriptional regulator [Nitrospiraceae bacterium]|nr:sigma-54-dependent Fis family transcriptional regulator [Nitrospiraceae bacterium]
MKTIKILLIEDDMVDRMAFKRLVESGKLPFDYAEAGSVSEARKILDSASFDVVISDYLLGDGTAFDILDLQLDSPVIITTGAGNEEIAVRAMKSGAYDYLIKDADRNYLKVLPLTVDKAIRQKRTEDRVKIQSDREAEEAVLIGGGGLTETVRLVELAASSDSPVFITGETGTGKTLVAKAIHYRRPVSGAPFISINCAALPENLIEAELFGHEKGAFTGAVTAKKGIFEMAEGGTLFLDEIGEMPFHLQSKLLSVIEDKQVRRLGGNAVRSVNVRITAATGIDLEKALGKTFRKDLFYRLSVIRIHIPSLRERPGDIPNLCRYLLKMIAGGRERALDDTEIQKLMDYDWPGNVREMKNILERAVILQKGPEFRPSELLGKDRTPHKPMSGVSSEPDGIVTLEELEKDHIRQTLHNFSGNITRTARVLDISLSTMKRKVKQYGLK